MGLAVLVTASEGDTRTLFENSVFVEDVVNRLRARCVSAFFSGEKFLHQMHREEEPSNASTENRDQSFEKMPPFSAE